MCIYCDYCVYHYKSTELFIYIGYWTLNKYYYYYYYILSENSDTTVSHNPTVLSKVDLNNVNNVIQSRIANDFIITLFR